MVARYSVSSAAPVEVKETRVIRYGDQILGTRETTEKRANGECRSEYPLPIPGGAAEGLYTVTTRIETATSRTGASEEKVTMFTVDRKVPSQPPPPPPGGGTGGLGIRVWTEKTRYKVGETVTFNFETTRDGYVTLVNTGTSGAVRILYPNRYSDGQAVKGKTRYSVPRPQDSYTLTISGPPGIELVYAVLTLQPLKFVETDFSRTREAFHSVGNAVAPLTRDINIVMKETPADKQAKTALEIEVVR
jgi:hypothetical protein